MFLCKRRSGITEENEKESDESVLRDIADFVSTFVVALVVMIAIVLVMCRIVGIHMFNVESGSMTPTYPVGSLVIVKEMDPEEIESGDVITFVMDEKGTLVTHRVVSVDRSESYFRTKGDANNVEDAMPVRYENTVGKVLFGMPAVGEGFAKLTAAENRPLMIGTIVTLLALSFVWDIYSKKSSKKETKKDEKT